VPYLHKQHGEHTWSLAVTPGGGWPEPDRYVCVDGRLADVATAIADGGEWQGVWRVGKKAAGRELDDEVWDQYPQAVSA
jgi:hypothetical protein